MNTSKWLPKQHQEVIKLFEQSRQLERELRILGKKFATDINIDLPDYYVSSDGISRTREHHQPGIEPTNRKKSAAS